MLGNPISVLLFGDERLSYQDPGIFDYFFEPESPEDNTPKLRMVQPNRSRNPVNRTHQVAINHLKRVDIERDYISGKPDNPIAINYHSLSILTDLINSVKKQAILIQRVLDSNRNRTMFVDPQEEEKFRYGIDLAANIPEGRAQFKHKSPQASPM